MPVVPRSSSGGGAVGRAAMSDLTPSERFALGYIVENEIKPERNVGCGAPCKGCSTGCSTVRR